MFLIIDLVAIAIIGLCIIVGYKQGLIKVAIKLFSLVVALVVALVVYRPVSNSIITNTEIDDKIEAVIIDKILPEGASEDDEIGVSQSLSSIIISNTQDSIKSVAHTFSVKIIELVSFIIIFIIVKIILKFITVLTDLIAKLPIIKQIDKLGGTIYGILHGFILVFVILAVISLASPFISESFINLINSSILCSILYNNNLLLMIIM